MPSIASMSTPLVQTQGLEHLKQRIQQELEQEALASTNIAKNISPNLERLRNTPGEFISSINRKKNGCTLSNFYLI